MAGAVFCVPRCGQALVGFSPLVSGLAFARCQMSGSKKASELFRFAPSDLEEAQVSWKL